MPIKYDDDDEYDPVEEVEESDDDEVVDGTNKKKAKLEDDAEEIEDLEDVEDAEDIDEEDEDELDDDDEENENEEDIIGIEKKGLNAKQNFPELEDSEDDNDDDDVEDDNYLKKFDENIQKNIIAEYHPELQCHNYDEVDILTRVVRDEKGVIIDPLHRTLPFITRYEKARIIGERAKQINAGAKPFVELDISVIDGYLIALKEFDAKVIPFIIKRPLPNGGMEYWKFKDLEVLA